MFPCTRGWCSYAIYRWEPGYRPEMDGDDDGAACEPWH
ncbi:excalibur calcium-binding domain-containing protein [Asticcacaulis currens]